MYEGVNGRMDRDVARTASPKMMPGTEFADVLKTLSPITQSYEKYRVFVGEELWSLYMAYHMLWFRSVIRFRRLVGC